MNQSLNIRLNQVSFNVIYFLWLAYLVSIGHEIITVGEWILALHEVTVTEVRDLTLALYYWKPRISHNSLWYVIYETFILETLQQCVCFVFNFSAWFPEVSGSQPPVVSVSNPSHANISFTQISHCCYYACCAFSFYIGHVGWPLFPHQSCLIFSRLTGAIAWSTPLG